MTVYPAIDTTSRVIRLIGGPFDGLEYAVNPPGELIEFWFLYAPHEEGKAVYERMVTDPSLAYYRESLSR